MRSSIVSGRTLVSCAFATGAAGACGGLVVCTRPGIGRDPVINRTTPNDADQYDRGNDDADGDDRVRLYVLQVARRISAASYAEERPEDSSKDTQQAHWLVWRSWMLGR